MGKTWAHLTADSQLRWCEFVVPNYHPTINGIVVTIVRIGPEKGVIHIATGAVGNAIWDMYARSRSNPLWKLIVDMSPVHAHFSLIRLARLR